MKKLICATLLLPASIAAADGMVETHNKSTMKSAPVVASSAAKDSSSYYARVDAGISMPSVRTGGKTYSMKNAPVFSAGAGYKFNEYFRSDLNVSYRASKAKKAVNTNKIHATALVLNGYASLPTDTIFTPYATAGAGVAHLKQKTSKSHTGFAWNVGAGSTIKCTDSVDADLGYKYTRLAKVNKSSLRAHEVTAGVIFKF